MTACTAAVGATNLSVHQICGGMEGSTYKGSLAGTIKVIAVTPSTSYTAGGDLITLLSTIFPNRIYWAVPMTATAKNATTGYVQVGLVPGTALTDAAGGYDPATWYLQMSVGATEATTSSDYHAYVVYIVACGC